MKSYDYDVIITGSGPIGLACGIEANRHNLSHLIIEKGCLVNSIYHFPLNMTFFSTSDKIEIGDVPFISHGDKPTRREALEYYRRVKTAWNLNVNTYETVTGIQKQVDGTFELTTNKSSYRAGHVIIATGYYDTPNLMGIPGEELAKVSHYFKEAHPYAEQKIIVVGAGNSAVDVALECFRRGAQVTMAVMEDSLKDSIKYWVKPDIENRIKEGSITAYFNSVLTEIRDHEVDIDTPGGRLTLENDFVLAMTGYQPDFQFLSATGIEINDSSNRAPAFDPESFESNIKGLYLAGVVCGGMDTATWFIENAREHPNKIIRHIIHNKKNYIE